MTRQVSFYGVIESVAVQTGETFALWLAVQTVIRLVVTAVAPVFRLPVDGFLGDYL